MQPESHERSAYYTLNSSPSLIYNPQLQNRLICNLQLLKPAKIQPSPPLDRFWPIDWWTASSKKMKIQKNKILESIFCLRMNSISKKIGNRIFKK